MLPSRGLRAARACALTGSSLPPTFLAPAWQHAPTDAPKTPQRHRCPFSTTAARPSKLGRTALSVPDGVTISLSEPKITTSTNTYQPTIRKTLAVSGPLGNLSLAVPEYLNITNNDDKTVSVRVDDINASLQVAQWGTTWSYLRNYITGVSEGHTTIMRLVGVGYRAALEPRPNKQAFKGQQNLVLKLGFTHPVIMPVPEGVKVTIPTPTRILLEGPDYELLKSFAGRCRQQRKPEPYKGKGVFVDDETIKLKTKKIS